MKCTTGMDDKVVNFVNEKGNCEISYLKTNLKNTNRHWTIKKFSCDPDPRSKGFGKKLLIDSLKFIVKNTTIHNRPTHVDLQPVPSHKVLNKNNLENLMQYYKTIGFVNEPIGKFDYMTAEIQHIINGLGPVVESDDSSAGYDYGSDTGSEHNTTTTSDSDISRGSRQSRSGRKRPKKNGGRRTKRSKQYIKSKSYKKINV